MIEPVLIIHGGAGRAFLDQKRLKLLRRKISEILTKAYETLETGSALEAVVHAMRLLEDDPEFNAGTGSSLQADGEARLSASLMDGKAGHFAGVINVEKIKNPILVAQALLKETSRVLSGEGAFQFAKKLGLQASDPRTAKAIKRWKEGNEKSHDTVGACALDKFGHLASATSTGGRGFEMPGRVSDSGMPVASFADSFCAISATGVGEEIMEEGLAVKIATRVRDGLSLAQAFQKSFSEVRSCRRRMGAIGLDKEGNVAWDTTTDVLIYGWQKGGQKEIF